MTECTTHHHACKCREAAFRELLEDIMRCHAYPNSGEYRECDKDLCEWCEKAAQLIGPLEMP